MDKTINPWRKDFPLLQNDPVMYLDNAATAQRPACVIEAVKAFYEQANANPLRGFYPLSLKATQMYEDARKTVQRFIHAPSERCVIFTRNTTEGLNLVAYSYALHHVKAGDEIVVSIMEHHSNMLPWQMVASQTGATLRYMDCEPDGTLTDETIEQTIGKKTKLVAIGHWLRQSGEKDHRPGARRRRCRRAGCGAERAPHAAGCAGAGRGFCCILRP